MANAGDACTAAKATFPMLSLNVKPKVFCAVLRARCACNPWLTSKGQGHKNLISKGEIGGKAWSFFARNQTIPLWFAVRKEEKFRYLHVKTHPLVLP